MSKQFPIYKSSSHGATLAFIPPAPIKKIFDLCNELSELKKFTNTHNRPRSKCTVPVIYCLHCCSSVN